MGCAIAPQTIKQVIAFHGHSCPGLAIGIRAAELALQELGHGGDCGVVAVVETDMCGVDAIQFLTGCTMGKGNLILRDWGKMAFSFYRRDTGKGFRAVLRPGVRQDMDDEFGALMRREADGTASARDLERKEELRAMLRERFLSLDLKDMFDIQPLDRGAPRPARILAGLVCGACGETVMESRTRRFNGQTLCIPCFEAVEQKQ